MPQPTGQRVDFLTFSGLVKTNVRHTINSTNGVVTLVGSVPQEHSNDSSSDFLGARDTSDTSTNGHYTVTTSS